MNKIKKILSVLLTVVMLFSAMPFLELTGADFSVGGILTTDALAADDRLEETYSGKCGDNLTWVFNTVTGELTISGTGAMYDYHEEYYDDETYENIKLPDAPWFNYRDLIISVVIGDGVTSIGKYAFYDHYKLIDATMTDDVTSIGECAFYKCTALSDVRLSERLKTIPYYCFCECDSLTEITIPDSVSVIGSYAFEDCDNLTTVTIGNGVEVIGSRALGSCDNLTTVTIGNSVNTIEEEAFYSSDYLTDVYYNGSQLKWYNIDIGEENDYLIKANIHFLDTTPMGTVEGACGENLKWSLNAEDGILTISGTGDMDDYRDEYLDEYIHRPDAPWFNYRPLITSIVIGDGVTSIGKCAFYGHYKLTEVIMTDDVTTIGNGAFYGCTALPTVRLSENLETIPYRCFYECDSLTEITIPDSISEIGGYAFAWCNNLTTVTIGNSVNTIEDFAFYQHEYHYHLTDVYYNGSQLKWYNIDIGEGNDYLIKANIHFLDTTPMGTVEGACGENLKWSLNADTGELTINGTGAMYDYHEEYYDDETHENIKLPDAPWFNYRDLITSVVIGDGVTSIGKYAFYDHYKLINVTMTDDVTSIGEHTFYGCTALPTVRLSEKLQAIPNNCFCLCNSLTEITIPDSVSVIGGWAFSSCDNLTTVTIGNGVEVIGSSAFDWCDNLTTVTIGSSVNTIEDSAFDCYQLTDVYYNGSQLKWYNIDIGEYNDKLINADIHFLDTTPMGTVEGACGENLKWSLNADTGKLTINGTGEMDDYHEEYYVESEVGEYIQRPDAPWFNYRPLITSIVIGDGVTSIGKYAFYDHYKVINVTMTDDVTSIGGYAFNGCAALSTVRLSESLETIPYRCFCRCNSLTEITIPDSVSVIGSEAFWNCHNLTTVTIGNGVEVVGSRAFWCCYNLTTVTIGDGIKTIERDTFGDCHNLKTVNLGSGVEAVESSAFVGCNALTNVNYDGTIVDRYAIHIDADNYDFMDAFWTYNSSSYDDGEIENPDENETFQWEFNEITGTLVILGEGKMIDYSLDNRPPWWDAREQIKYVSVGSVDYIGKYTFDGLDNLEKIYYESDMAWDDICAPEGNDNASGKVSNGNGKNDRDTGISALIEKDEKDTNNYSDITLQVNAVTRVEPGEAGSDDKYGASVTDIGGENVGYIVYEIALSDETSQEVEPHEETEVLITMPIPLTWQGKGDCSVFHREADGDMENMNGQMAENGKTISFTTNHFSEYLLVKDADFTNCNHRYGEWQFVAPTQPGTAGKEMRACTICLAEEYREAGGGVMGDITNDGKINSTDALMVLKYSVELITLTDAQKVLADVYKDGKINSSDALQILNYSVGKITSFD